MTSSNMRWFTDRRTLVMLALTTMAIKGVAGGAHEERLINEIFNKRHYIKYARPVFVETEALEVAFGITLQQIIDVDEKNEMIHTNLWLNYEWYDYRLTWNATNYGGVQSIRLPSRLIWTPDILLYNSADEDIDSKFPSNVVVYSTGRCSWVPLGLFISSCSIDIRWFPFDDQRCRLKFGSWTYDGASINLTMKGGAENAVDLDTYQESGEWQLIAVTPVRNVVKYECCPEQYIDITFTIHIRRLTLYYGFNIIIPCALTSVLALATFLQPPDAGEKIGLGITILLSLSVFQLIVAGMVPATSLAVPLVGIYFAAVMIMCTVSVMMTVLVLNFHHRKPDMYRMSPWVRTLICDWLAWLLRMSRPGDETKVGSKLHRERSRRLRQLAVRAGPPSLSLIGNVHDATPANGGPYRALVGQTRPVSTRTGSPTFLCRCPVDIESPEVERSLVQSDDGTEPSVPASKQRRGCCAAVELLRPELAAILAEVRCITRKLSDNDWNDEQTSDWKFAAMVVDRLSFWTLTVYLVVVTVAVFGSVLPRSI